MGVTIAEPRPFTPAGSADDLPPFRLPARLPLGLRAGGREAAGRPARQGPGLPRNPYTAGVICAKVARYHERFHHPDRLGYPLRRKGPKGSGEFERIGWDDALDAIAEALLRAEQRHGSETVWPYWYAGTMGLVQRDGIQRLTHAKRYSRFISTICVTLSDTGFVAGHGTRWGVPATEIGDTRTSSWSGAPTRSTPTST